MNEIRGKLNKPDQYALLIWDVFRGQQTEKVGELLEANKILYEFVPNNMTADFQVLDLTVNGWLKHLMKMMFNTWFAEQLRSQLDSGTALEHIEINFRLTTMKSLHAGWLISCYNKLSSSEGKEVILSGWKASGITEAVAKGVNGFNPVVDPFHDVDPFHGNEVDFVISTQIPAVSTEYAESERCEIEDVDGFEQDGSVEGSSGNNNKE